MSDSFVSTQELIDLAKAMDTKYQHFLNGRNFSINALTDDCGVYVTTTLSSDDSRYVYPVEARMDYKTESLLQRNAAFFLIDYIDLYFEDYLMETEEESLIPIDWTDFEWDTVKFQMKAQILNSKLESEADQLLKLSGWDEGGAESETAGN
jgi:hypothetical protein